ncbi:hypothetical protein [Leptolyngbya sp. FACHB-17]|nr:hypothetical protein [Leptolyngbya sp. FACHB-17]
MSSCLKHASSQDGIVQNVVAVGAIWAVGLEIACQDCESSQP